MNDEKVAGKTRTVRSRAIVNARRAIAEFVESNSSRLSGWLEQVAEGIPKRDADGRKIRDAQGSIVYLVKPDPATAMKLVADLTEYHLPKLSRADVAVAARVEQGIFDPNKMSNEQLAAQVFEALGIVPAGMQEVIEGEAVEVPEWLEIPSNS